MSRNRPGRNIPASLSLTDLANLRDQGSETPIPVVQAAAPVEEPGADTVWYQAHVLDIRNRPVERSMGISTLRVLRSPGRHAKNQGYAAGRYGRPADSHAFAPCEAAYIEGYSEGEEVATQAEAAHKAKQAAWEKERASHAATCTFLNSLCSACHAFGIGKSMESNSQRDWHGWNK